MSTVILDIETVSLDGIENSDIAKTLTKNCKNPEEVAAEIGKLALYPLTGKVVCVGMCHPESKARCQFHFGNSKDETDILAQTWEKLKVYNRIVTFNGRGFDIPFLLTRSAILNATVSRHDLMGQRFASWPHCDLMDQLSFYGATRKFSLEAYCLSFGIPTPKGECDGSKVGEMFAAGEHQKIADYCARDCVATAALYEIWLKRMQK